MLKDDRTDQSIMLIFWQKQKKTNQKKTFTEKKMALNYRGFLQSCCVFLLLYLFFNIIQRSLFHSSSLIPVRSLIYSQLISSFPRKRKDEIIQLIGSRFISLTPGSFPGLHHRSHLPLHPLPSHLPCFLFFCDFVIYNTWNFQEFWSL